MTAALRHPISASDLRAWREAQQQLHPGLTQRQVAAVFGVSVRQWRRWETGESEPERLVGYVIATGDAARAIAALVSQGVPGVAGLDEPPEGA